MREKKAPSVVPWNPEGAFREKLQGFCGSLMCYKSSIIKDFQAFWEGFSSLDFGIRLFKIP